MKIAVCFSGQFRTGSWAIPAIKSFIGEYWDNCDFFVHTWDSYNNKNYSKDVINYLNKLMNVTIDYSEKSELNMIPIGTENLDKFLTTYNPKLFLIENYKTACDNINKNWLSNYKKKYNLSENIYDYQMPMLYYSFYRSIQLKKQYEQENNFVYDIVIKLRTDVILPMDNGTFYIKAELKNDIEKFKNDPTKFYASDDVYWISTSDAMDKFSLIWDESLKTSNLDLLRDFSKLVNIMGLSMDKPCNASYSFLRNPFKTIPLNNFKIISFFEHLFISGSPSADLQRFIINMNESTITDEEFQNIFENEIKSYINDYYILNEFSKETGAIINSN